MRTRYFILLTALVVVGRATAGVETVSIPSQDGKLQLPGYWFQAATTERRPAVILLHGCDGTLDDKGQLMRTRFRVAELFNVEKIHLLVVDSFTPRGHKSICHIPSAQRSIDYTHRRDDAFAAIQWLARQEFVDKDRIAILGYSNGAGAVLKALDRTDKAVRDQSIQPKAGIAFYPPCDEFASMWNYEISAPLLLMIGELDDWTPAGGCRRLQDKVKRAQPTALFDLVIFPESYHGFDSAGPVKVRTGLNTRSHTAHVGGNPAAREQSHQRMFDFLSAHLNTPLSLTHEERLKGHRYALPAPSGFARTDDIAAVPLDEKGRERYQHYLDLPAPKAFAITEKGRSYYSSDDAEAAITLADICRKAKVRCSLYAVDDRVVWRADATARLDPAKLQRKTP